MDLLLDFEKINNFNYSDNINTIFSDITPENIEKINDNTKLLVQTDLEGVIQYANENYKNYFGRGKHTIIGKEISDFDHPAMPKSIKRMISEQVHRDDDTNAVFINRTLVGTITCTYAEVDIVKDRYGEHIHVFTRKKNFPEENIFNIAIPFYKYILQKEEKEGVDATYEYLRNFIKRNEFKDFNSLMDFLAYGEKDKK